MNRREMMKASMASLFVPGVVAMSAQLPAQAVDPSVEKDCQFILSLMRMYRSHRKSFEVIAGNYKDLLEPNPRPWQIRSEPTRIVVTSYNEQSGKDHGDIFAWFREDDENQVHIKIYPPDADTYPLPETPYKKLIYDWASRKRISISEYPV